METENEINYFIYGIYDRNTKKVYVGSTKHLNRRYAEHKSDFKRNRLNLCSSSIIFRINPEPEKIILDTAGSRNEARKKENSYITNEKNIIIDNIKYEIINKLYAIRNQKEINAKRYITRRKNPAYVEYRKQYMKEYNKKQYLLKKEQKKNNLIIS